MLSRLSVNSDKMALAKDDDDEITMASVTKQLTCPFGPESVLLLRAAVKNNFFIFDSKWHKQVDGVAMGNPLGPTLGSCVSMRNVGLRIVHF